ncbi:LysR family transcriptional regulator [Corynebacterium nuruki]|uniref:LysR family transcriptional regulator n=1 Tax=Corynebacterium nuruki TaxID=1032851 RepID=UPI0039BFFB7E
MTPELRHLRAFVAAAGCGTLTGAAEILHVSQPTLTRTLQQLERMVGVRLLVRSAHGVALTDDGTRALGPARDILDRVDAFTAAVGGDRTLRLGFAWLLPPVWFATFRETCTDLGFTVTPVRVDDPVAALEEPGTSHADLALVRNTHRPLPASVTSAVIGTEDRCATFPADSDLARRYRAGERITWDDLVAEPLVTNPNSGTTYPGSWTNSPVGRTVTTCANFEEWIELIASGAGIGAVPVVAKVRAPHPGVLYADLPDVPPSDIALAWRTDAETPALRDLLELLIPDRGCCSADSLTGPVFVRHQS